MSTMSLTLLMVTYLMLCVGTMYFCLFADPNQSKIAMLLQVTLPQRAYIYGSQLFGQSWMETIQQLSDKALVLVYFIVVGGSWSVVFWYIYPWLYSSECQVSKIHGIIGIAVFVSCFVSWGIANTSRPGIVTARNFPRYDHYPYDHLLFLPNQRCPTTLLPKLPRSKFDRIKYHGIVPRYDHFCGWTYNTYGEENYRWFLLFLCQHVIMCFYGSYVTAVLFHDEIQRQRLFQLTFFDRATGETISASYLIILQYMFARRTMECSVLCIMFVMGIALTGFLGYHVSKAG